MRYKMIFWHYLCQQIINLLYFNKSSQSNPSNNMDKETQQLLKNINIANETIIQSNLQYAQKFQELNINENYIDLGYLNFQQQEIDAQSQQQNKKSSFFSQIPHAHIDQQTQEKILNFKFNFVSARRKDQLFKRHRKEQEQKHTLRKKQVQKTYSYKLDNLANIKGEFTLRRGQTIHTCSVTGDDLDKLRPETDLNDTIIANYLKYLQIEVFSEQLDNSVFVYSSFFIQKLIGQLLRQDLFLSEKHIDHFTQKVKSKVAQNFKNVKRWTRRTDIFQKQFLIIPINAFKHWYCLIVFHPGGLLDTSSAQKPYIVNCDSMFQQRPFIHEAIRTYLQIQLQDKKQIKLQINKTNLPCYQLLLPRQTNTHDCGLYMLTYIQHLLFNKNQLQDLQQISNREKLTLFPRSLIYSMRQRLKQLFIKLIQTSDESVRKEILRKYKEETEEIIATADEIDYDKINEKEFKKYEAMNSHLLENSPIAGVEGKEDELEYACRVRFYLDPEINYYQRDKPLLR